MFALLLLALAAAEWAAGVAAVDITPRKPLWMAGFAARKRPSEGTLQPLHAKALALRHRGGRPAVLVTTDILGFTSAVARNVGERARAKYGLTRDRLLLNSSHTHCGPVIDSQLAIAYDLTSEQWADIREYTRWMEERVVDAIGAALKDWKPARLSFGNSEVGFARNRRTPPGPVDHDVPVLRVERDGGTPAVVFGYACHNTTIGPDQCNFNGDYSGFAQALLEQRGGTAFFLAGCGADSNPSPRGTVELAQTHGEALARAVEKAGASPVGGPLGTAFEYVRLDFRVPGREELETKLQDPNGYVRKHARAMLDLKKIPQSYQYPIQVWRFGGDLTLVALAGEVVVDYALRLKKELVGQKLWVAGYSNDVFAYIPSRRVLEEGGYEGGGAMIYYVQPGPFMPPVEETIIAKVRELVSGRTRRPPSAR